MGYDAYFILDLAIFHATWGRWPLGFDPEGMMLSYIKLKHENDDLLLLDYRNRYVCMYVCMYVCTYLCTLAMYVCMYVCTYVHTYVCMYICMCVLCSIHKYVANMYTPQVSLILPITGACYTSWTTSNDTSRGYYEV